MRHVHRPDTCKDDDAEYSFHTRNNKAWNGSPRNWAIMTRNQWNTSETACRCLWKSPQLKRYFYWYWWLNIHIIQYVTCMKCWLKARWARSTGHKHPSHRLVPRQQRSLITGFHSNATCNFACKIVVNNYLMLREEKKSAIKKTVFKSYFQNGSMMIYIYIYIYKSLKW